MSDTILDSAQPYQSLDGSRSGLFSPGGQNRKRLLIAAGVGLALVLVIVAIIVVATSTPIDDGADDAQANATPAPASPDGLEDRMQVPRLMGHLVELEKIAAKYSDSRSVETGYNASVEYVLETLRDQAPGFRVWTEPFQVTMFKQEVPPTFETFSPYEITFTHGVEFLVFRGFAGPTNVSAQVELPAGSPLGCAEADFAGFTAGLVALIKRGDCSFQEKVDNAVKAGAVGVLIYNDGADADRMGPFNGALTNQPIPAFALSFTLGVLFSQGPRPVVHMAEFTSSYQVTTLNVLAETREGDPKNVIVVGSHLDSVPAGPGINDNGSGSSVNLELAIAVHDAGLALKNKIRFAWWAAEEIGLLGSRYYVSHLNATNRTALGYIAMNLNFDMLGSPNYFYGVYDGKNAEQAQIRNASGTIQKIFTDYFEMRGLSWDPTPFNGRSDYGPFIEELIPAGGLFSGAEELKTTAQRDAVGGLANAAYDPCYHQRCDTVENINQVGYIGHARAAAYALEKTAIQEDLRQWLNAGGDL